jgi:hypothetical protein
MKARVRLHERLEQALPRNPRRALRQRRELGHRPAIDGDAKALTGLDAAKHVGGVISQLSYGDVASHVGTTVAHELRCLSRLSRRLPLTLTVWLATTINGMSVPARLELDLDDARRRLAEAAEEAKRLEDAGEGFAANAVWERYQLIADAIEAQERRARVAERLAGSAG